MTPAKLPEDDGGKQSAANAPTPWAALGQLAAFMSASGLAVLEFFFGRRRAAEPLDETDEGEGADLALDPEAGLLTRAEDAVEGIGRKIAPFPGQEG